MKKTIKELFAILTILLLVGLLAGCKSDSFDNYQKNVTIGKKVYFDKDVVYFATNNLICTAKIEGTKVSELTPIITTASSVNAIAVYRNYLFVLTNEGLFRYPMSEVKGEERINNPEPLIIGSFKQVDLFEISDEKVFYMDGNKLYYIPAKGGDKAEILGNITDYEVTDKGVYYTEKDGDLQLLSFDLGNEKEVGRIAKGVKFSIGGPNLYFTNGDIIEYYSINKTSIFDTGNKNDASEGNLSWSNGQNLLYLDRHHKCHLITPSEEVEVSSFVMYPDKSEGCIFGNYLVSVKDENNQLQIFNINSGDYSVYDFSKELKNNSSNIKSSNIMQEDRYDITKGSTHIDDNEYVNLKFNGFRLTLPNNKKWGWEQIERDTVRIYLYSAQKEGYGGTLLTIKAYNLNDKTFKELPNYRIVGINEKVNKQIIISFPVDVQWNKMDAEQVEDYNELRLYLQSIGYESSDSPLQIDEE